MCATSLEVILESTQTTIKDMKCIIDFRGNQTDCMHSIHMGPQSISIMGTTICKSKACVKSVLSRCTREMRVF